MVKQTIEARIRAVIAEHPNTTRAEVARRLGLSKQRVSQACAKYNIRLRKWTPPIQYTPRRYAAPPELRAPVITGGVASNHTICGTISELLVAVDLMARGFKVYLPIARQKSHDLIAVNDDGETLTFEVRSAKRRQDGGISVTRKHCASEYWALVILGEPIQYEPELPPARHRPETSQVG